MRGSVLVRSAILAVLLTAPLAAQTPGPSESPVTLDTPAGTLAGTLLLPAAPARPPVVLIIAGSGPTDRDGNSAMLPGRNNSLKLLAEALAAQGIASLRYDKRGLAGSAGVRVAEADLRFEHLVEDAAGWVTWLRNDQRFTTVTVAGHSEGSLLGMLAARAARADAFVSIAGVGRRASDVLRDQLRPQLSAAPALWEASETILAGLEAGKTVTPVPAALISLYRLSVQPYMISWLRYTPTEEIARLTVPVLIAQGTTDIQVGVREAEALKAAVPSAELVVVEGMNHVLKMVPADQAAQVASYGDPSLALAPELGRAITAFVRRVSPIGYRGSRSARPETPRMSPRTVTWATIDEARLAIEYGQPSKRERAIWGALVPWGRVWMPGADEATTFTTNATLRFGTLVVPPGDYTIYTWPAEDGVRLILSRETGQFHTVYNEDRDLGRVPMTLTTREAAVELMTFALEPREGGGGVFTLIWDTREYSAPFVVER